MPNEAPWRMACRTVATGFFVGLGLEKFFSTIALGTNRVTLPTGPQGFAIYLHALGVPFPLFNAWLVIAVEVLCGLGLVLSTFLPVSRWLTRLCALPLSVDMLVATLKVGVPNVLGHPVHLDGVPVTDQFWRLPVEASLLCICVYLLWRPVAALAWENRSTPPLRSASESTSARSAWNGTAFRQEELEAARPRAGE